MPNDDAEASRDHHKLLGRPKWRERFFSRDKVPKAEGRFDTDVSDFLHGTNVDVEAPHHIDSHLALHWPSAAQNKVRNTEIQQMVSKPSIQQSDPRLPLRKKKRNTEGLSVRFTTSPPEIIGEGGDEAEMPPIEISTSRTHSTTIPQPGQNVPQIQANHDENLLQPSIDSDRARRTSIQRVPTGLDIRKQPGNPMSVTQVPGMKPTSPCVSSETCQDTSARSLSLKSDAVVSTGSTSSKEMSFLEIQGCRTIVDSLEDAGGEDSDKFSLLQPDVGVAGSEAGNYISLLPDPQSAHSSQDTTSPDSLPHYMSQSANSVDFIPLYHASEAAIEAQSCSPDSIARPMAHVTSQHSSDDGQADKHISEIVDEDPMNDIYIHAQQFNNVFQLCAAAVKPIADVPLLYWLRAGIWWFLKGRGGLERVVRTRSSSSLPPPGTDEGTDYSQSTNQAYIDLAKSVWIAKEVVPQCREIHELIPQHAILSTSSNESGLSQLLRIHHAILKSMRALAVSMKKNQLLPPPPLLVQGYDINVWVSHTSLTHMIAPAMQGKVSRKPVADSWPIPDPFFEILLGDTKRHFSFGRMFVDVVAISESMELGGDASTCLLSVTRGRTESQIEILILSQDGQLNLHIQSDKNRGLTWDDVHWKAKSKGLRIHLTPHLDIAVQFSDSNFKTLRGIHDYIREVELKWQPLDDEHVVFDEVVKRFQYLGSPRHSGGFPADLLERCEIRLFEKKIIISGRTIDRRYHSGHRLVIKTPPETKSLNCIDRCMGQESPILFSYLRGDEGAPALLLKTSDDSFKSSMIMTFQDVATRAELHSLLNGLFICENESIVGKIPLKGLKVSASPSDLDSVSQILEFPSDIIWQQLKIIDCETQENSHNQGGSIVSEHLRICVDCNYGTIADRINLGTKIVPLLETS